MYILQKLKHISEKRVLEIANKKNVLHAYWSEKKIHALIFKICLMVRKKPYLSRLLKNGYSRMTLELQLRIWKLSLLYANIALSGIQRFHGRGLWRGTLLVYMQAQMTNWGARNVSCTIAYGNMLLGARKNVYQNL